MEKEITYQIEELLNNTYRIDESGAANCYLVIGDEKALLIDSCWGSGDLKGCVAQLTNKPVIVTMTHRHPDHTFGARQFGDYTSSASGMFVFHKDITVLQYFALLDQIKVHFDKDELMRINDQLNKIKKPRH